MPSLWNILVLSFIQSWWNFCCFFQRILMSRISFEERRLSRILACPVKHQRSSILFNKIILLSLYGRLLRAWELFHIRDILAIIIDYFSNSFQPWLLYRLKHFLFNSAKLLIFVLSQLSLHYRINIIMNFFKLFNRAQSFAYLRIDFFNIYRFLVL